MLFIIKDTVSTWTSRACQYLVLDTHFLCPEPDSRSRLPVVARNNKESRRIACRLACTRLAHLLIVPDPP